MASVEREEVKETGVTFPFSTSEAGDEAALDAPNRILQSIEDGPEQGSDQTIQSPKECDCPPWVLQCAHFPDGTILRRYSQGDRDRHLSWVAIHETNYPRKIRAVGDRAEVRAAFYAAEEALLRGDA